MIQLRFRHISNTEETYYSGGFTQIMYLEADLTTPIYEVTREMREDADGTRIAIRGSWTKAYNFTVGVVPEYVLNSLYYASMHSTIEFIDRLGNLITCISMDVQAEQLDDCYFRVTLRPVVAELFF